MDKSTRLFARVFNRAALLACTLALGTSSAWAALQFIPSPPGVYQSSVTSGALTESFDGFSSFSSSGSVANGTYVTTGSPRSRQRMPMAVRGALANTPLPTTERFQSPPTLLPNTWGFGGARSLTATRTT